MTGIMRVLLSLCTRWASREVTVEELNDLRVAVTEGGGGARIRLSGLLGNSALGICAVTVHPRGGCVNIVLRQRRSNGAYSGRVDREFSVPAGVREVTLGSGKTVIWRRD
ncbi:MAG: hypothetical protein Q3991_00385 [Rothia sp. (in: high G+C Gram-positive bacteria)]|uniref:hypothetical protein n=1 Tax=Rothia sp. (in: high G+C Gram-positive bacteria) TaxID=1885016 RepID=UPI0026DB3690|nr:hypothetical protein [Rothia sp. (in: high G+C Gram-positive bacteria)]MDO4883384.1 hypothetical protein [Rothia sp. (in: high G+C Gram-positive bacteria)]